MLDANSLTNIHYAEPYAGGAAVALALLFEGYATSVSINDLSRPVFAFWHSALHDTEALCRRISRTRVSMAEWRRQRAIYDARESADIADLGFATLFLNRTNRSGIISGGVIGGKQQTGNWALDARFNKPELLRRIRRVGLYRTQIRLYQLDALAFTNRVVRRLGRKAFVFYDPPYIEKGDKLYLNNYSLSDHRILADRIVTLTQPWVVTYDHEAVKHNLYPNERQITFGLHYSAQGRYQGTETMFLSNALKLPEGWGTVERFLLTPKHSDYPLYGTLSLPAGTQPKQSIEQVTK